MVIKDVILPEFRLRDKDSFSSGDVRKKQGNTLRANIGYNSSFIPGIVKCGYEHPIVEEIRKTELKKMRDAGNTYSASELAAKIQPKLEAHFAQPGYGINGDLPDISFVLSEIANIEHKTGAMILYDIRIKTNETIGGVITVGFECTPMPATPGFGTDPQWGVTIAKIYNGLLNHTFENTENTNVANILAFEFPVVTLPELDWSFNPLFIDELTRLGLNIETVSTQQGIQLVDFVKRITL